MRSRDQREGEKEGQRQTLALEKELKWEEDSEQRNGGENKMLLQSEMGWQICSPHTKCHHFLPAVLSERKKHSHLQIYLIAEILEIIYLAVCVCVCVCVWRERLGRDAVNKSWLGGSLKEGHRLDPTGARAHTHKHIKTTCTLPQPCAWQALALHFGVLWVILKL